MRYMNLRSAMIIICYRSRMIVGVKKNDRRDLVDWNKWQTRIVWKCMTKKFEDRELKEKK